MWTDLSMKDKSELMSLFLKQGISSLSDMRRIYDGEQDIDKFNFKRVSTIEDRPKDPEPYIDKNWTKEYKDLPLGYKKVINELFSKMNFKTNDYESLYNSHKYWNIINAYYKDTPSERLRDNDSPTKDKSEYFENHMNRAIYNREGYVSPNMKYAIPYDESKEIVVPTIGRVPTNALDSLAKYSYQAEIPLYEGLGLSGQETNFGAIPIYNMQSIPKDASQEERDIIKFNNRALGNASYFRNYGYIPAEYMVRDFRYNLEGHAIDRDVPPLLHAFQYYKQGKYNPGDPNHTNDVRERGEFMINTEPIQEWIKSSPYAQKALQIDNGNITDNLKAFGGRVYDGEQYNPSNDTTKVENINRYNNQTLLKYAGTNVDPIIRDYMYLEESPQKAAKFLAERNITENKDVVDYFNSYVNSDGYKRIQQNQSNWWKQRHPYRKYIDLGLHKEGAKELKNIVNKVDERKALRAFNLDTYSNLSFFVPNSGNAYIGNIPTISRYPNVTYEFEPTYVTGHEVAHRYNSNLETLMGAQREALQYKINTKITGDKDVDEHHDNYLDEIHSDVWGLKYLLFKEGIYDSRSNKDITIEEIKKLREKYPNLRPLMQSTDEELVWRLNHIASLDKKINTENLAAFGGKIHYGKKV